MAILLNKMLYVLNTSGTYEVFTTVDNEIFLTADKISSDVYRLYGDEYNVAVKSPTSKRVVRIYLLNKDETLNKDISEYVSDWSLDFTYQQGITRTGNITLMNYKGEWNPSPVNNSIWKGSKFKIDIGIFHNGIVFWKECGIYVCGDISLDYNKGTVYIPLYDKFALLDGTVSGSRASAFSIPVGTTVKNAIEMCLNTKHDDIGSPTQLPALPSLLGSSVESITALPTSGIIGKTYLITTTGKYYYCHQTINTFTEIVPYHTYYITSLSETYRFDGNRFITVNDDVFDTKPIIFPFKYINSVTPYSITADENCTIGSIILELAEMISCDVYYNTSGNLTLTAGATTSDDLVNNSILWDFIEDSNQHTRPVYDIKFSELTNQIIVGGSIENGRQYKATVVNENAYSQMNVHMTIPHPMYIEDSNLVGDDACLTRARYEMVKQGRLGMQICFDSIYIPHLECNFLITLTDSTLGFDNEKFVINSIQISSDVTMSLKMSNVSEVSFVG